MPPSQEELDLAGGKRPWVAPKVSLASIPHVVLGRIHEGRGPIAMGGRRMVTRLLSGRARNPGKDAHAPLAARSQRRYISGIGRKRPRDWSDDESQGEGGQGKGDESEDEDIPGGEASDSYDGGSGQATDTSQSEYQDEDSS